MKKVIHHCDKCHAEEVTDQSTKSKYRKVKFFFGDMGSDYVGYNHNSGSVGVGLNEMYLCPECYKPLGITDTIRAQIAEGETVQSISDRLYELFVEMIEQSKEG